MSAIDNFPQKSVLKHWFSIFPYSSTFFKAISENILAYTIPLIFARIFAETVRTTAEILHKMRGKSHKSMQNSVQLN